MISVMITYEMGTVPHAGTKTITENVTTGTQLNIVKSQPPSWFRYKYVPSPTRPKKPPNDEKISNGRRPSRSMRIVDEYVPAS